MSNIENSKLYLPRRRFLQLSGFSGLNLLLSSCGMSLFDEQIYNLTEPLNRTVEEWLLNPQKLVPEFPVSAIEPDKLLVNTFDFTPQIDRETFRLKIDGEVARPLSLSLTDLEKMPLTTMTIRHVCVEGWAAIALCVPSRNIRTADKSC